jgi:hypothetical protein
MDSFGLVEQGMDTQKSRPLAEDRLFAVFSGESSLFKGDGSRQRTTYCCRDSAISQNRRKFYLTKWTSRQRIEATSNGFAIFTI